MNNQNRNQSNPLTPQGMYENMLRENPAFRDFVEANKGKTPQQIASDYGLDFNMVRQALNSIKL